MAHVLTWLGHSAFQLKTTEGKIILIDPWLNGNPMAPFGVDELPAADYVLITHDHADHAGDVPAVVQQTGGMLIAQPETTARYKQQGVPEDKVVNGIGMNIGGTIVLDDIKVTMVDAYHTSETGAPSGYILTLEDGKVLYHAGDTGLHANMKTWGQLFDIDLALLPIGSVFTMDGRQAALALKWLQAKAAQPMHYKTFPALAQNADEFVNASSESAPNAEIHVVNPGEDTHF